MDHKTKCHWKRIAIGLPILVLIAILMLEGIEMFVMMVFLCTTFTMGVVPAIFIVVAYLIGTILQKNFSFFSEDCISKKDTNTAYSSAVSLGELAPKDFDLIQYVIQVKDTMNNEEIRNRLIGAGWSADDIDNVLSYVEQR